MATEHEIGRIKESEQILSCLSITVIVRGTVDSTRELFLPQDLASKALQQSHINKYAVSINFDLLHVHHCSASGTTSPQHRVPEPVSSLETHLKGE